METGCGAALLLSAPSKLKTWRVALHVLFTEPKSRGSDLDRCCVPYSCTVAGDGAMCTKVFFLFDKKHTHTHTRIFGTCPLGILSIFPDLWDPRGSQDLEMGEIKKSSTKSGR